MNKAKFGGTDPDSKSLHGIHITDSDCVLDENDTCTQCGVYHSEPCPKCQGRGFHNDGCPEYDG